MANSCGGCGSCYGDAISAAVLCVLLYRFRLSPSFNRDSLSSVVVKMCLRLRGLHHALEIISDPVKYGIFPGRASLTKLMEAFAKRGDVDGKCVGDREVFRVIT